MSLEFSSISADQHTVTELASVSQLGQMSEERRLFWQNCMWGIHQGSRLSSDRVDTCMLCYVLLLFQVAGKRRKLRVCAMCLKHRKLVTARVSQQEPTHRRYEHRN